MKTGKVDPEWKLTTNRDSVEAHKRDDNINKRDDNVNKRDDNVNKRDDNVTKGM